MIVDRKAMSTSLRQQISEVFRPTPGTVCAWIRSTIESQHNSHKARVNTERKIVETAVTTSNVNILFVFKSENQSKTTKRINVIFKLTLSGV